MHDLHKILRLLISDDPPLDSGTIWSIHRSFPEPQMVHLFPSLAYTLSLVPVGILAFLVVLSYSADSGGLHISHTVSSGSEVVSTISVLHIEHTCHSAPMNPFGNIIAITKIPSM